MRSHSDQAALALAAGDRLAEAMRLVLSNLEAPWPERRTHAEIAGTVRLALVRYNEEMEAADAR